MPYFHVAPMLLAPGSVIEPGNWGRILKLYTMNGNGFILFREHVLETIRASEFTAKPSRLTCIFLIESEQGAINYLNNTSGITNLVYEVRPLHQPNAIHQGDYGLLNAGPNAAVFDIMANTARAYWSGQQAGKPEILVDVPVEVVRRVTFSIERTSAGIWARP